MAKTTKKASFFENVKTLEELKKQYHALAKKFHSDNTSGDDETMKQINAEYDKLFKTVKNKHVTKDGKMYEKETDEKPGYFRDLIYNLLKLKGLYVEVIGCFVWVSGETKANKDALKSMGFRWHSKKECWYKSPDGYRGGSRRDTTMDDIRSFYGVQYANSSDDDMQIAIG